MKIDLGYRVSAWTALGDPLWGSLRYGGNLSIEPTLWEALWLPTRPSTQANLRDPIDQLIVRTLTA